MLDSIKIFTNLIQFLKNEVEDEEKINFGMVGFEIKDDRRATVQSNQPKNLKIRDKKSEVWKSDTVVRSSILNNK